MFSPTTSIMRNTQWDKRLPLIRSVVGIRSQWDELQQTLEGHNGWVTAVAFSPNGKTLASASSDTTIRLWNSATGAHRQTLHGHNDRINAIAFSHDDGTLASASADGTIRLWETLAGTHRWTLDGHRGSVASVAFSHDGKTIVSASEDKSVRHWDTTMRACYRTWWGPDIVTAVAFSPDGKTLATASGGAVQLWDADRSEHHHTLVGHQGTVMPVTFSSTGMILASAGIDGTVRLWDVVRGGTPPHGRRTPRYGHVRQLFTHRHDARLCWKRPDCPYLGWNYGSALPYARRTPQLGYGRCLLARRDDACFRF